VTDAPSLHARAPQLDPEHPGAVGEPLLVHGMRSRREREARVADLLTRVGLRPEYLCRTETPVWREITAGRFVSCHRADELKLPRVE
jgi:hypothetical protein